MQRLDGGDIRDTVHLRLPEMPLEGGHHLFGRKVVIAADLDPVTVERQHRLQRLNRLAGIRSVGNATNSELERRLRRAEEWLRRR